MKFRFNRLAAAILTVAACGAPPCRVDAAAPMGAAKVLAQMQRASGGDLWGSIKTLHIVEDTTEGGVTRSSDRWEDLRSGRYAAAQAISGGMTRSGFDGVAAWLQGRSGIPYTLGDVDSALVAADESFRVSRGWWFPERRAATIALLGQELYEGRTYDVISVTPEGGRPFQAWIDHVTHLLARTDEQQAEERVITSYSDYRAVQGLLLPFTIRTGDGVGPNYDVVSLVKSIEVNPTIPDSAYSAPSPPPSDVHLPPGQDSVEVPFRLISNNRILVPVTLNGRLNTEAEFDSGGSLVVQPGTAAKLRLNSEGSYKTGGGGEGFTTSSSGRIQSLSIGGARIDNLSFDSFALSSGSPDQVLIGLEVLQRFVVYFDFDRMVMTLTRPSAFKYDGHGAVIPFHFQSNQPEVRGAVDGISGLFTIDTGDSSSLLLIAPFAHRYDLAARYQADVPYSGTAVSATHGVWARHRAGTVSLNGANGQPVVEVHDPVTRVSLQSSGFDADRNVSANIGLGILRQFNLTFDYARQQLILQPNHLFGERDIANRTGFRLKAENGSWTVTTVYPHSPAADAGLAVGDHVTKIAGYVPSAIGEDDLANLLKGPVGSSLSIEFPGRTIEITLRDVF